MILFIFITFCTFLTNASPQYYYIDQPAVFHIPTTYNAFPHQFSTFHGSPHYQQFKTVSARIPLPVTTPAPTLQRTHSAQNNDPEYRGFAYQTRTDNGATSHVLFVTGPQAQQVNSRIFNNFNSQAFEQNVNQARTVASEMIDPVQKTEEKQNVLPKSIQDIYSPRAMQRVENNDPFLFFRTVFQNNQNPSTRLINFYSKNTDLFAAQVPGYPANVAPLPQNAINPRSLHFDNNNTELVTERQANEEKKSDSEVAAESIITNTRFKLNNVNDVDVENQSSQSEESTPTTISLGRSTASISVSSGNLLSSPSSDNLVGSLDELPFSGSLVGSLDALPSTQRAFLITSHLANMLVPESSTSIISSSSVEESAIKSRSDNTFIPFSATRLFNSATVNGIPSSRRNFSNSELSTASITLGGLLTQRIGAQPETLAEVSDIAKESPSSESSDISTSESSLTVKFEAPGSSYISTSTPTAGLYKRVRPTLNDDHISQERISGVISYSPVSADKVIANVSTSGFLTANRQGPSTSIAPITTSSGSDESDSSTTYSTFTIVEETTNSVTTAENDSTVDQTTEQLQLTTNNDNIILLSTLITTMKTSDSFPSGAEISLAETAHSSVITTMAGDSNEDNTTEHVSITTDSLMTTTSQ